MLNDHYIENAPNKDVFERPKPDYEKYYQAQRDGELLFITVRDLKFDLRGYMALFLRRHPHYDVLVAIDDLHYLMPDLRGLGVGKKMIVFAEDEARRRGAKIFSMRCKADSPHGFIFESLGYALTDYVYLKDLRHAPVE